jgi:DNA polymerase-3 subunit delta
MVAIKPAQAAQFLKAPPAHVGAVLFFGSDPGLVSERSDLLARRLAAREDPPGEVLRLDDSDLDSDPDRLGVELDTRPMFSGRKIIRAAAGRRISAAVLKPLLEQGPHEGFLIVEAGNLKPADALRALFEGNAAAAAVACYADDGAAIDALIADVLGSFKKQIAPEAREELAARLGADRALSRAEIEKLALYALNRDRIELADVEAVVGDAADLALERIPEAAASGDTTRAISDLGRAIASGESAQAIILITQRYFLKLHRARTDADNGRSIDEIIRTMRPPLHFKQKDIFASQVRRWTRPGLDQALKRIAETAKAARLSSQLEDTLAERLILALSAMAGGSLRNSASTGAARRR